jgi:hypothetical protein
MLEKRSSTKAVSAERSVHTYLEYNRKLQMWAWLSAAVPLLIFSTMIIYGTIHLERLEQKTRQAKSNLAKTQVELTTTQDEIKKLEERRAAVLQQINTYSSSLANPKETGQSTFSVSGHPVTISVNIAESRDHQEAEKVADLFRSHGYTVSGIDVKRLNESPHETTVRFFQYDRSTVAIGRHLVALMKGIGFNVRTEFDDEFVGRASVPAPGTYEIWIGTTPSYSPPNVTR